MMKIGVLGAGSFGTSLAIYAASSGFEVDLWARRPELVEECTERGENHRYLPGVALPAGLNLTSDLRAPLDSDLLIVAVPSHGFRQVLREFFASYPRGRRLKLISATKGIETEHLARMSQGDIRGGRQGRQRSELRGLVGSLFRGRTGFGGSNRGGDRLRTR